MENLEDNEWVQPIKKHFLLQVAGNPLVRMDVRIYNGRVQFRVRRIKDLSGHSNYVGLGCYNWLTW
jgi:hypothetical protein